MTPHPPVGRSARELAVELTGGPWRKRVVRALPLMAVMLALSLALVCWLRSSVAPVALPLFWSCMTVALGAAPLTWPVVDWAAHVGVVGPGQVARRYAGLIAVVAALGLVPLVVGLAAFGVSMANPEGNGVLHVLAQCLPPLSFLFLSWLFLGGYRRKQVWAAAVLRSAW